MCKKFGYNGLSLLTLFNLMLCFCRSNKCSIIADNGSCRSCTHATRRATKNTRKRSMYESSVKDEPMRKCSKNALENRIYATINSNKAK